MIKVEDRAAIPEAGHKIPESEPLSILDNESSIPQANEDEQLMSVEIALVHALQYLTAKSDNSQL